MPYYFSRISIQPTATIKMLREKGFLNNHEHDKYRDRFHKVMWEMFEVERGGERPFVYNIHRGDDNFPVFHIVSEIPPQPHSDLWSVQTKEYNPQIQAGEILDFSLCASPTARTKPTPKDSSGIPTSLRAKDNFLRGKEIDAIIEARKESLQSFPPESKGYQSSEAIIQSAGRAWLIKQSAKYGFSIPEPEKTLMVFGYSTMKLKKENHFSSIQYKGILRVEDEERFRTTLFEGLGKGRAFGCGLLMVKRRY
jgi:CRISPR system Cascade subunit CasE